VSLNRNEKNALEALLRWPTVAQAARKCGLAERTLWRYLEDDVFKAELRKRQDKAVAQTTAALVGMSGDAIEALRDLLQDPETPPGVKARVALGWLQERRKAVELDDLAQRIGALEELLQREAEHEHRQAT
jgi:hypothetical protein